MHWCQDETNAVLQGLMGVPVVGYVLLRARLTWRRVHDWLTRRRPS